MSPDSLDSLDSFTCAPPADFVISEDLEQMSLGVTRLKAIGKAMGDELDHGNKLIDRIGSKVCGTNPTTIEI